MAMMDWLKKFLGTAEPEPFRPIAPTPWHIEDVMAAWGGEPTGYMNIIAADGRIVCAAVPLNEATAIMDAINAHAADG